MKVLLDYEPASGQLSNCGVYIATFIGLNEYKESEPPADVESNNIDSMVKLKNSGFTAKEVIEISKAGLL